MKINIEDKNEQLGPQKFMSTAITSGHSASKIPQNHSFLGNRHEIKHRR